MTKTIFPNVLVLKFQVLYFRKHSLINKQIIKVLKVPLYLPKSKHDVKSTFLKLTSLILIIVLLIVKENEFLSITHILQYYNWKQIFLLCVTKCFVFFVYLRGYQIQIYGCCTINKQFREILIEKGLIIYSLSLVVFTT